MAGGARHAAASGAAPADFLVPQGEVRRRFVGARMAVVVAAQARFHRGLAGVEAMRAVAAHAGELGVPGRELHRQFGHARLHRRQALLQPHAVQAGEKAVDLCLVAAGARGVVGFFDPGQRVRRVLGLMAGRAVHPGLRVRGVFPFHDHLGRRAQLGVAVHGGRSDRLAVEVFHGNHEVAQVAPGQSGIILELAAMTVADQEVLVQRAVVVKIVAAAGGASIERHALVAGALLVDVGMAAHAEIVRKRHPDGPRDLGPVFAVAGHALARVELGQRVGVARVGEFADRMRVVHRLQLRGVAREAGLLNAGVALERLAVAGGALEFDLVMRVAQLAGHEARLLSRRQQRVGEPGGQQAAGAQPDEPHAILHQPLHQ